jgi:hypothetical protein
MIPPQFNLALAPDAGVFADREKIRVFTPAQGQRASRQRLKCLENNSPAKD